MKLSPTFLSSVVYGTLAVSAMPHKPRSVSAAAVFDGQNYVVNGVGKFNTHFSVDFTTIGALPANLTIDTDLIGAGYAPYSRMFTKDNVVLNPGDSLSMLVPGGQTESPILSSEIRTTYTDILYGSVRTVAKASSAAGTCHGFFFYKNDTQEIDIEILTSNSSAGHFTNQAVNGGDSSTTTANSPSDITTAYHEYRTDWIAGKTMFYIDGVLVRTLTTNVASIPGPWIWNNWSNGGSWTAGPPTNTSDLRIQSIEAYFNRTSISTTSSQTTSSSSAARSSTSQSPSTYSTASLPQYGASSSGKAYTTGTSTTHKTSTTTKTVSSSMKPSTTSTKPASSSHISTSSTKPASSTHTSTKTSSSLLTKVTTAVNKLRTTTTSKTSSSKKAAVTTKE